VRLRDCILDGSQESVHVAIGFLPPRADELAEAVGAALRGGNLQMEATGEALRRAMLGNLQ